MAYQINKTDGTIISTVADGQIDNQSTDLTLIGKNYSGFGEAFNENLIKLLENFASTSEPENPIAGQIWFDATESKVKVYTGSTFVPVSSATISQQQPATLGVGDLWFNDLDKQLYFFDGNNTILLGPSFSDTQLKSGIEVQTILDNLNQSRVITLLYNNGILIGIFAKDNFTPKEAIEGFSGNIVPGFNAGDLAGIKFNVTATNAEQLGGADANLYVRTDTASQINGTISINTNLGITIGDSGQAILNVKDQNNVVLTNTGADRDLVLEVRKGINQEDALVIDSSERSVNIYPGFTDSLLNCGGGLEVTGDVTIKGNLTINDGDVAQIKTSELVIEDKVMVLAQTGDSSANSDQIASGGGIILKGTNDHVFLWSENNEAGTNLLPTLAAQSWNSSDHINLVKGKTFKIDGITVISGNSLGPNITSIPGVTSFGAQNVVNIGPGQPPVIEMRLEDNRISTVQSNLDLELRPDGSGNVALIGEPRITGLKDPVGQQDAATKEYVDDTIETRAIALSIDLSDAKPNSYIINDILTNVAPPADFRNGTIARVLCNILNNSATTLDIDPLVSTSTATFTTPTGTAPAVTDVSIAQATVSGSSLTTTRIIKEFQILGGVWTFVSDTILPP